MREPKSPAWMHYRERLRPLLQAGGFANPGRLLAEASAERQRGCEILCLGCDAGDEEMALAASVGGAHSVRCLDPDEGRVERARSRAQARGLAIEFGCADLDRLELEPRRYDLVVVRAVTSRLVHPGRLLRQVARGLADGGMLHLEDHLGQNDRLLWEENEWFANALLERLPETLTGGARIAVAADEPPLASPHQEEVDLELRHSFSALFEHRHGAFVRFVGAHPTLGSALGAPAAAARNCLDFLIDSDDSAVRHELLRPLEVWGVYRPVGDFRGADSSPA